ncbi:Uncharacterised protein [Klebsiella michiganensis]|uniref:Uncharacterized protein n=1 Tax=Klebsiella michiganensis TaxID=1134687 RepID=A0A7H4PRF7_9ENTR|nr:Uncharacterised protein [Klebsiella michiganensis]
MAGFFAKGNVEPFGHIIVIEGNGVENRNANCAFGKGFASPPQMAVVPL